MSEVSILSRRVMNMVSRGIISKTDDEPGMQNVQVSLLYQEGKAKVERMQNYGFSGHAPGESGSDGGVHRRRARPRRHHRDR